MIAEDTLQQIIQRFEFIEAQMSEGAGDIAKLAKEYSDLRPVVEEVRAYQTLLRDISDAEAMMDDPDMRELAAEELPMLRAALPKANMICSSRFCRKMRRMRALPFWKFAPERAAMRLRFLPPI